MPVPETTHDLPVSDELVRTLIAIARAAHDEERGIVASEAILILRLAPMLLEELLRYRRLLGERFAEAGDNLVRLPARPRLAAPAPGPEAA